MIFSDYYSEERCGDDEYERHMFTLLKDLKCEHFDRHDVNYIRIPKNCFPCNEENVKWFNDVYQTIINDPCPWNEIIWTKSGGISKKTWLPAWGISKISTATIELVIFAYYGSFRIIMGKDTFKEGISGSLAFCTFRRLCKKHGIELEDMTIRNGEEVKKTIEKAPRKLVEATTGETYICAHHLDLNSSYMSGIAKEYPVLKPVIKELYDKRKENSVYKAILTHTYGYFQSSRCTLGGGKYTLSHLSKAALDYNNAYIADLTRRLEDAGYGVLSYNTDGIWYYGNEEPFHDYDEGKDLGQWKNDHVGVKIRFKSVAAYEYMEDGICHVKVSGSTNLDKSKPNRDGDWEWGDLMDDFTRVVKYYFDEKIGIVEG